MIAKRLVILANSRKQSGRCVAGISISHVGHGKWVRPVSIRPEESLNEFERLYANKQEPKLLDVVDVSLIKPEPHGCHVENWLVSTRKTWKKVGELSWEDAQKLAEHPESLWMNGGSTYAGLNNEVPTQYAKDFDSSIGMIHVPSLKVEKRRGFNDGDVKIYAEFSHNDVMYKMSVTDCVAADYFRRQEFGVYDVGESLLTISLSEPFVKNGGISCQYKLVAAIIPRR